MCVWGIGNVDIWIARATNDPAVIRKAIHDIKSEIRTKRNEHYAFRNTIDDVIAEAKKNNIDASELERLKVDVVMNKAYRSNLLESRIKTLINAIKTTIGLVQTTASGNDVPHKAMKTSYPTAATVMDTMKDINDEFKGDKWFELGVGILGIDSNTSNNGSTDKLGNIYLTSDRLNYVRSAMAKIGNKESDKITDKEADAMATFWHEITHNRNKYSLPSLRADETRYMEMANEFVARKTLPEFYKKLGCGKTPHPNFMNDRGTTDYNDMVKNYDFVIDKLGLDFNKVLKTVRKQLYTGSYLKQVDGLKSGLVKGGIKKLNGTRAYPSEIEELVEKCKNGTDQTIIENWLRLNGFIR